MAKNKGGRPLIITESVLQKLEEAFEWGCTDLEACGHADISKGTLYNYQEANPKFLNRKEMLKENPIRLARQSVIKGLKEDHAHALKFLERKRSKEFGTHSTVDSNVMINPEAEAFYNKRANENSKDS